MADLQRYMADETREAALELLGCMQRMLPEIRHLLVFAPWEEEEIQRNIRAYDYLTRKSKPADSLKCAIEITVWSGEIKQRIEEDLRRNQVRRIASYGEGHG